MGLNSGSISVRRNFYAVHKQENCSWLIHGRAGVVEKINFLAKNKFPRNFVERTFRSRNFSPRLRNSPSSANLSLLIECTTRSYCNTNRFPLSGKLPRKLFLCFGGKFNKEEIFRRIFSKHKRPCSEPTPTTLESGTFGQLSRPLSDTFASGRPNFNKSATYLFWFPQRLGKLSVASRGKSKMKTSPSNRQSRERIFARVVSLTPTPRHGARPTEDSLREISPVCGCVRRGSCAQRRLSACFDCPDHATRLGTMQGTGKLQTTGKPFTPPKNARDAVLAEDTQLICFVPASVSRSHKRQRSIYQSIVGNWNVCGLVRCTGCEWDSTSSSAAHGHTFQSRSLQIVKQDLFELISCGGSEKWEARRVILGSRAVTQAEWHFAAIWVTFHYGMLVKVIEKNISD